MPENRALQEEYISIKYAVTVRFLDCAVVGRTDLTEGRAESSARVCTLKEMSLYLEGNICVIPEDRTEAFNTCSEGKNCAGRQTGRRNRCSKPSRFAA
jgi:hypothetical protein